MGKKEKKLFLFIIGVSILSRGLTLITPELWGDETNVGHMSLRVMAGEFPVFFFGQNFMGSLEAFLGSSLFQLVGPSPFALELLPVILSIVFLVLLYLLAKTFFGSRTALISIALLSIPPLFLLRWSHEARPHYLLTLIFGSILLLISHPLIRREVNPEKRRLLFALIGLISGIGWWTNYLIINYILPVGFFLFLRDKKIFFNKNFWLLIFAFLIGSLPLWLFNLFHHFPVSGITNLGAASNIVPYLRAFFINAFPILLGFLPPLKENKVDLAGYLIIGPIYIAALFYYVYRFRDALKSILFLSVAKRSGGEILLFLFGANILLNLMTNYGICLSDNDQRYLLPLYSCLPVFVAVLLTDIEKKYSFLAFLVMGLVLSSNLTGNLRHDGWTIFNSEKFRNYQINEAKESRLIDFLIKKGYHRIYGEVPGSLLTFKSREAIICANPYQENYLKYADLVDSSNHQAYLSPGQDQVFEWNMKALGGSYRKVQVPDGYVLYTDFFPPREGYRVIPRQLWRGTSSLYPEEVKRAFDGDVSTGWGTGGPQTSGTFFQLDLGRVERVGKISYIPDGYREVPAGYQVAVSLDGKRWQVVSEVPEYRGPIFWSGPGPKIKVRHGRVETLFPPRSCRFVKISLLENGTYPWSIQEIFLFSPADDQGYEKGRISAGPEIVRLLEFLKDRKINFVYADHWLSAVLRVKSQWKIGTIISNFFAGDNGEQDPPAERLEKIHIGQNVALVVERGNGFPFPEKLLEKTNNLFRKREIGPFWVYYDFTPHPYFSIQADGSSNVNASEAKKALDGDPASRWTSGRPQEPGQYFQVDLKTVRLVHGCSIFLGNSIHDYPRSLKLSYSLDGSSWKALESTASSSLYWTGETLLILRSNGEKTDYCFSPVNLRYLRLIQEGHDPVYWWSIHELRLF